MGRLLTFLLFLLLVAYPSFGGQPHFSATVSVTDTNTNTEIVGIIGTTVLIINDGTDPVYFNVLDGVATVSGASLNAGESMVITAGRSPQTITNVGLICDTGETASVRIFAFPTE